MPLVPGGMLYTSMENFVKGYTDIAEQFSRITMAYALGIAVGISLVYSIYNMINRIIFIAKKKAAKSSLKT